jgi:hypothetical protein
MNLLTVPLRPLPRGRSAAPRAGAHEGDRG